MPTTLTDTIAGLVAKASAGSISAERAASAETNLTAQGLSSLNYLKLIDALETELGVYIDLEGDVAFMTTVQGIADYVRTQRAL